MSRKQQALTHHRGYWIRRNISKKTGEAIRLYKVFDEIVSPDGTINSNRPGKLRRIIDYRKEVWKVGEDDKRLRVLFDKQYSYRKSRPRKIK